MSDRLAVNTMVLVNKVLGFIEKTWFFTREKKVKNNTEEVSLVSRKISQITVKLIGKSFGNERGFR